MKHIPIIFLALVMLTQGCGYTTKSALTPEWKNIHVAPIVNQIDFTNPHDRPLYAPLLEVKLRNTISEQFLRDGYLKISDADDADVVLKISLKEFRHDPLRFDGDRNVLEWRIVIVVAMELFDVKNQKIIFTESHFVGDTDQFRSGTQSISEDSSIELAIADLAKRVVERVVEHW